MMPVIDAVAARAFRAMLRLLIQALCFRRRSSAYDYPASIFFARVPLCGRQAFQRRKCADYIVSRLPFATAHALYCFRYHAAFIPAVLLSMPACRHVSPLFIYAPALVWSLMSPVDFLRQSAATTRSDAFEARPPRVCGKERALCFLISLFYAALRRVRSCSLRARHVLRLLHMRTRASRDAVA